MFNDYEKEIKTIYHLIAAVSYHDKPEFDYTITLDSATNKGEIFKIAHRALKTTTYLNAVRATRDNYTIRYVATDLDEVMDHDVIVYEDDRITVRYYIETELTDDPYDLY